MADVNQNKPTYRALQAEETRRRILAAARKLFRTRGYVGATVEAIAADVGVVPQTVYAAFGSKKGLLAGLRRTMLADAEIPRLMAQAGDTADPRNRLNLAAKWTRQQMESSYDIIAIHRQAANADPDFAVAYRAVLASRGSVMDAFIAGLGRHLRPDISTRHAADIFWALSNEELYREFVVERGWTPDEYEDWLAATLTAQLIGA